MVKKSISELDITAFRGVTELRIADLGDVNIIVGDNNSGKTSILEAIQLIADPVEYNFFQVAGLRNKHIDALNSDLTEAVASIMHRSKNNGNKDEYVLDISATIKDGRQKTKPISKDGKRYIKAKGRYISFYSNGKDTPSIECEISSSSGVKRTLLVSQKSLNEIRMDDLHNSGRLNEMQLIRPSEYEPDVNVGAVYAVDHVIAADYKKIINSKSQTDKALRLLKSFNENIISMRYLNKNGIPVPVLDTDTREAAPLSDYGDGLKKALAMMEAILKAENGVLLIDEYESAIHPSAMNSVFSFMLKACKEMNTQLFVTTHSLEALDELLGCDEAVLDNVRVITLKKKNGKIHSRVIDGTEAKKLRSNNNAELR